MKNYESWGDPKSNDTKMVGIQTGGGAHKSIMHGIDFAIEIIFKMWTD